VRPIVTDRVGWSVTVTVVSLAKTAQPIEIPLGLRTRIGPGNRLLDGSPDRPMGMGIFDGKGRPIVKYIGRTAVSCAKTAKPIKMPFGLRIPVAQRNHELDGGSDPRGKGHF